MTKIILSLTAGGLIYALFNYIAPLYISAEESINIKLCAPYTPETVNNILYCQCTKSEKQRPGKCNEKYKND